MTTTELPQCRWRGERLANGNYCCTSPRLLVSAAGVPGEICGDHCPYVDQPVVAPVCRTIRQPDGCRHVGSPTGERVLCPSCRGHVEVKIRSCTLHRRCTLVKQIQDIHCCATCPDYKAKPNEGDEVQ
jgi:hypothetical protein